MISKIFETVICDQLDRYFVSNKLLCPQQYGFTKNSSTELAALEVIDRLLNQLNKQKKYQLIFILTYQRPSIAFAIIFFCKS